MKSGKTLGQSGLCLLLFSWAGSAFGDYRVNFPEPATPIARDIYDIHMQTATIVTVIFFVIVAFVAYSVYVHRKSRGYPPDQNLHKTWAGRWIWIVVPAAILGLDLAIAGNAARVLETLWLVPKDEDMMDVKVIGHQWWWEYEYPDYGITVESRYVPKDPADDLYLREVDHPLVLPTHTKIRFLHTSADVIHAFWVHELGMKKDAIPGYITETWAVIEKEGTFRGQCAELCGAWHARMPIVVEAVSPEKFTEWVEQQKMAMLAAAEEAKVEKTWSMDELMERGRAQYNKHCAACHQLGGEGLPPTFPPLKGSAVATGPITDNLKLILEGRPEKGMPAWKHLNDLDIAAIATYVRNAFGNNTGDLVQPADVAAAR